MPAGIDASQPQDPPVWALDEASRDLYDVEDRSVIVERAWELAREAQQLHDERHDKYDDPDQGGEG